MRRILLLIVVCTTVLVALGVSTVGRQQSPKTSTAPTLEQQTTVAEQTTVPEHVTYGMFLRDLDTFNQKAEAASIKGDMRSREAYRNFYKGRAGWNDAEFGVLNEIAAGCQRQLKVIDAKARKIIDERRRVYYPNNQVRKDGQLAPPSPELKQLQAEHDAAILAARDQIRLTLGEQSFQRLQEFLKRNLVPTITVSKAGN